MWYAVETAFINGNQFASRLCFKDGDRVAGICYEDEDAEPHNSCQKFMDGKIEIHYDWFQTKEQAKQFANGGITYVVVYQDEYRPDINSTISHFIGWHTEPCLGENLPYRGIYEHHNGEKVTRIRH